MRKSLAALAILMCAAAVASANGIGFYGAYWKPSELDHTFGVGGKLQVEVVPSIFIEARATYFPRAKDKDSDDIKVDIMPLEAGGVIKLPVDQLTPYAGGGIGYYMFRVVDEPSGISVDVDNKIGLYIVAGLELEVGDTVSLFGEAKYTWLDEVKVKASVGGFSDEDKGDLSGLGVNVGLLLKW